MILFHIIIIEHLKKKKQLTFHNEKKTLYFVDSRHCKVPTPIHGFETNFFKNFGC